MASLNPSAKTKRISLVSDPDGWIDIKDTLQLGDMTALAQSGGNFDQISLIGLSQLIVDWSLEDLEDLDEFGKPKIAKITIETVNRLPQEDYEVVLKAFGEAMAKAQEGLSTAEKKASPSGLVPEENSTTATPASVKTSQPITVTTPE